MEIKLKSHTIKAETGITVTVTEMCDKSWFVRACERTSNKKIPESRQQILLREMYLAEHSPIRSRRFWVDVEHCPVFVANHFARHHEGVNQFHQSHRSDRCKIDDLKTNRLTPTSFSMDCNAQALINMAKVRLCYQASEDTRLVMRLICDCMRFVDIDLASVMLPKCEHNGGICRELKPCGRCKTYKQWLIEGDCLYPVAKEDKV